jgi:hypothetical protein
MKKTERKKKLEDVLAHTARRYARARRALWRKLSVERVGGHR